MPRRASSQHHPVLWIFVVFLILIFSAGGYYLYSRVSDPFRTLQALDTRLYLENANSLRGNLYKVKATIDNSLAWSPSKGRLLSVKTETGDVLPVFIPASLNHVNLQKGQTFNFKIKVSEKGILHVEDLKKS